MPEQTYPPYVSGALTVPRQLNRWLDINPQNGFLSRTSTVITLPSFTTTDSWNGYSDIVSSFNIESPNAISLKPFTAPANPNYVLCVSYRVSNVVTRYMIWDATGSVMDQTIPFYVGQPLKKNFRFEIWNTSQGAASQASAITIYTSKAGTVDYRWGDDTTLVGNDGQVTNFNATNATSGDIVVSGAGEPLVNGLYTAVFSNTWKNATQEFAIVKTNVGVSLAIWGIRVAATNHVLYITNTVSRLLSPDSLTWNVSTYGTTPAPTTNQTAPADFLVPMTFPATSVSTIN